MNKNLFYKRYFDNYLQKNKAIDLLILIFFRYIVKIIINLI